MNREIKFRAWEKGSCKIIQPFHFMATGFDGSDWIVFGRNHDELKSNFNNPYFSQQLKIMQYTGLKDKNGKEIYEGDVVLPKGVKSTPWLVEEIGEDRDGQGWGFCWSPYGNGTRFQINIKEASACEVIGNIYENPELLNP